MLLRTPTQAFSLFFFFFVCTPAGTPHCTTHTQGTALGQWPWRQAAPTTHKPSSERRYTKKPLRGPLRLRLRCSRARSRNHVNAPLGHGEASLSDCDRSETQLAHVVLSLISFRATHPVGVEKIIKPSIGLFHLPGGLPPAGHLLTHTNEKASWRA